MLQESEERAELIDYALTNVFLLLYSALQLQRLQEEVEADEDNKRHQMAELEELRKQRTALLEIEEKQRKEREALLNERENQIEKDTEHQRLLQKLRKERQSQVHFLLVLYVFSCVYDALHDFLRVLYILLRVHVLFIFSYMYCVSLHCFFCTSCFCSYRVSQYVSYACMLT